MLLRNPRSQILSGAPAIALVVLLAACSGATSKAQASTTTTTKPKVLAIKTSVLKVGSVDVESAGPPNVQIDPTTGRAVLGAAQAYINDALFTPLRTGELGAGYATLFDPSVRTAATGADENALTDLNIGKVTSLTATATPVELSALAGPLGQLMYIATDFDLALRTGTAAGKLSINHHVELTFSLTAKTWLVTAYRVDTVRKSVAGTTTTTSTTSATGGTAP